MAEVDPQSLSPQIVRLEFDPSERLRDAFRPFFDENKHYLADELTIRSMAEFGIQHLPSGLVRPYPYVVESHDVQPIATRIIDFERRNETQFRDSSIPLVSYFKAEVSPHHSLRLHLRLLPGVSTKAHFAQLPDLKLSRFNMTMGVYTDIFPAQRAIGKSALADAIANMNDVLKIGRTSLYESPIPQYAVDESTLYVDHIRLAKRSRLTTIGNEITENPQTA